MQTQGAILDEFLCSPHDIGIYYCAKKKKKKINTFIAFTPLSLQCAFVRVRAHACVCHVRVVYFSLV